MEKLPEEFNMVEIMAKVPPEERTPYVVVAFQEAERMNMLTNEMRRTLKELDLGLKVRSVYSQYDNKGVCVCLSRLFKILIRFTQTKTLCSNTTTCCQLETFSFNDVREIM